MIRKSNQVRKIWVAPEFHRKLKRQAADEDTTVVELTRRLAKKDPEIPGPRVKKKKDVFDFRI